MDSRIYLRMPAYVATIAMHLTNCYCIMGSLRGDVLKIPDIYHFYDVQLLFFTGWSFVAQIVYATFSFYCDYCTLRHGHTSKVREFNTFRDAVFTTIIWPASTLVCTIFWLLYYYDRNLVYPVEMDLVITPASNHVMHTYIIPVVLWELMTKSRHEPKSHKKNLFIVFMMEATYMSALSLTYKFKGVWIYPIFGKLYGSVYLYLFILFILFLLTTLYYLQWIIIYILKRKEKKTL